MRALILSAIVAVAVSPSSAQVSMQASSDRSGKFAGTATFGAQTMVPPVVTGAPYSGEEVSESVRVGLDGTRFTQKTPGRKVWRDTEGRTRTERPFFMGPNQPQSPLMVEITDPVAGYKYTLDTQKKVAHRQAIQAAPARGGARAGVVGSASGGVAFSSGVSAPPPAGMAGGGGGGRGVMPQAPNQPPRPRVVDESLGTQMIDGVLVEGHRNTMTYAVGAMGNDREFSVVHESWGSPELKISILTKMTDPRNGENTFRIENLNRTPPDPMLFAVPSDYTVVDEAGGFTIEFKGQ